MEISELLQQINQKLDALIEKTSQKKDNAFFDLLKSIVLEPSYPEAVDPSLICNTSDENDKIERATNIVEIYIEEFIENKSLLDFGCGEGHVALAALDKNPSIVKGYDIKSENFSKKITEEKPNLLTSDWNEIAKEKYDVILMYDVFDHLENEDSVEVMKKIKSVLNPDGKIYARMHPFISRHATHYYHTLNKAFVHLIFSPEELEQITGVKPEIHINKVFYPYRFYNEVFKKAKINTISSNTIENEVEPYFKENKMLMDHITKKFNFHDVPLHQMSMSFIDFVLN